MSDAGEPADAEGDETHRDRVAARAGHHLLRGIRERVAGVLDRRRASSPSTSDAAPITRSLSDVMARRTFRVWRSGDLRTA
jgi:hypothetical protein